MVESKAGMFEQDVRSGCKSSHSLHKPKTSEKWYTELDKDTSSACVIQLSSSFFGIAWAICHIVQET